MHLGQTSSKDHLKLVSMSTFCVLQILYPATQNTSTLLYSNNKLCIMSWPHRYKDMNIISKRACHSQIHSQTRNTHTGFEMWKPSHGSREQFLPVWSSTHDNYYMSCGKKLLGLDKAFSALTLFVGRQEGHQAYKQESCAIAKITVR